MKLSDIITRTPTPLPWAEGEKIPWDEPGFSERMLREHLAQTHDAASRRFEIIDRQIVWIQKQVLSGTNAQILDLGCGPGFYASRLAALGHTCFGIDFSPASIAYAKKQAEAEKLACTYKRQDIRTAEYGEGYDLALLLFGEFNVFSPQDTQAILAKVYQALNEGGTLLLEPHTFEGIKEIGEQAAMWYTEEEGLFSATAHIYLMESFWNAARTVSTNRYYIIDAATSEVTRYALSAQAYTNEQYQALLASCGFQDIKFYPSLTGLAEESQKDLLAITARK